MGFLDSLADVQKKVESRGGGSAERVERVKAAWLSLKPEQTVRIAFLQELDRSAAGYSEKNGTGLWALEHSNPDNWQKKALCTIDEGACYGCEKGWMQKVTLYVNVLVDDGNQEPYVAILSKGHGKKGGIPTMLMQITAEDETITDVWFSYNRTGSKKDDTVYTLLPKKAHGLNVEDYEVYDLKTQVFTVPYERQEAYYLDGAVAAPAAPRAAERTPAAAATTASAVW